MTVSRRNTTTPLPSQARSGEAASASTTGACVPVGQAGPARTAVVAVAAFGGAIVAGALPWLVNAYLISLATTALIMILLAWSTQLLSNAGLPSLGQAGYLGVGAYTAAILADAGTTSGPAQLVAAALAGAVIAAVGGLLAVRARDTTFLMATFALGALAHAAANQWAPGGSEGIHTPPVRPLPGLPAMTLDGWAYLYALTVTAIIAVGIILLDRTRYALVLRAIAEHEPRAQACGHPTSLLLWTVYTIAGAVAGAGGSLIVAGHHYVTPADLSFAVSALGLAAAAIGRTSRTGAALAAIALVAARDWAGGLLGGYGTTLLGVLLLAVAFLPRHRLGSTLPALLSGRRP